MISRGNLVAARGGEKTSAMPPDNALITTTAMEASAAPKGISDLALDLIIETLISAADAHQRSVILHDLVQEIMAVVSWLGPDELGPEFLSLKCVLVAACEHRQRMQDEPPEGGPMGKTADSGAGP